MFLQEESLLGLEAGSTRGFEGERREGSTCGELAARCLEEGLQCPLSDEEVQSPFCALYAYVPVMSLSCKPINT